MFNIPFVIFFGFIFWLFFYSLIFAPEYEGTGIWIVSSTMLTAILYYLIYKWRRRNGKLYGSIDIQIFKIVIAFLKEGEYSNELILSSIKLIFKSYSPKQTEQFYKNYLNNKIDVRKSCILINRVGSEAKLFLLHALFDIANKDKILTINEENFIEQVRHFILVHPKTLIAIKQQYINKGTKTERDINEEQNRKKTAESFSKSFLPYNAYKILGITPSVTKVQLKKVYRTLAKKYHPDKSHGLGEEIIQKAEDKFQEITEAYEVIKKFKNYR